MRLIMLIREKDKDIIIKIAKKTLKTPCQLLAYGSRVSGEAHDISDLDMVILSNNGEKLDIEEFINFKEELLDSSIPILIQLSDWNRIPKSFHKNIISNNEEIIRIN
ncbi:MAG: nucleotidyltransferase domain-containing protein [Campylobacterota bacterium]|nr:nucleotidyltransferase domain-containing protein [Campylobacterota bacterium]